MHGATVEHVLTVRETLRDWEKNETEITNFQLFYTSKTDIKNISHTLQQTNVIYV